MLTVIGPPEPLPLFGSVGISFRKKSRSVSWPYDDWESGPADIVSQERKEKEMTAVHVLTSDHTFVTPKEADVLTLTTVEESQKCWSSQDMKIMELNDQTIREKSNQNQTQKKAKPKQKQKPKQNLKHKQKPKLKSGQKQLLKTKQKLDAKQVQKQKRKKKLKQKQRRRAVSEGGISSVWVPPTCTSTSKSTSKTTRKPRSMSLSRSVWKPAACPPFQEQVACVSTTVAPSDEEVDIFGLSYSSPALEPRLETPIPSRALSAPGKRTGTLAVDIFDMSYAELPTDTSQEHALQCSDLERSLISQPLSELSKSDADDSVCTDTTNTNVPEPSTGQSHQQEAPDSSEMHLRYTWVLYRNKLCKGKSDGRYWAGNNLDTVLEFRTVEMFWRLFNNIVDPSSLPLRCAYHMFKTGISPTWEDEANAQGGHWAIGLQQPSPLQVNRAWLYLCLAMIGDQFDDSNNICGVVIKRSHFGEAKFQLWLRAARDKAAAMRVAERVLDVLNPIPVNMVFKSHCASVDCLDWSMRS